VVTGHNFESILPKDHPCHVCFKLADWFQRRKLVNNFPIGSYVKTTLYVCWRRKGHNSAKKIFDRNETYTWSVLFRNYGMTDMGNTIHAIVAAMFVNGSGWNDQSLYQVSVHLAERFQRRRLKCEKLTDNGRQVMAKAHIDFGKVT